MYEQDLFGCWLWRGELADGYGVLRLPGGRRVAAHRAIWERHRGPLPARVQLDHTCRRRNCVRPAHLDPVTNRENSRRVFRRHRAALELCPAGSHELSDTGIDTPEGGRICRICSESPTP